MFLFNLGINKFANWKAKFSCTHIIKLNTNSLIHYSWLVILRIIKRITIWVNFLVLKEHMHELIKVTKNNKTKRT